MVHNTLKSLCLLLTTGLFAACTGGVEEPSRPVRHFANAVTSVEGFADTAVASEEAAQRWQLVDLESGLYRMDIDGCVRVAGDSAAATATISGGTVPLALLDVGDDLPEEGIALDPGRQIFRNVRAFFMDSLSATTAVELRPGPVRITIMARGSGLQGLPRMRVALNEEELRTFEVHAGGEFAPYVVEGEAVNGPNTLSLTYTNEVHFEAGDRNLFVNDIQVEQKSALFTKSPRLPPPRDLVFEYQPASERFSLYRMLETMPGTSDLPEPWRYYELRDVSRPAMALNLPAEVTFDAHFGRESRLVLSAASIPVPVYTGRAPVQLEVVQKGRRERVIQTLEIQPTEDAKAGKPHWQEIVIDWDRRPWRGKLSVRATAPPGEDAPPLVLLGEPRLLTPPAGPERRPNVVLISIDTLRADHLGCYGYDRPVSPALDAFAEGGVLFENCIAQSNWTLTSHTSMLSGLYVSTHGVVKMNQASSRLDMLASLLKDAGYQTYAQADGGLMRPSFGFTIGFDFYRTHPNEGLAASIPEATPWLELHGQEPFFLFLHTYDVHDPYFAPKEYRDRFEVPPRASPEFVEKPVRTSLPRSKDAEVNRANLQHAINMYDAEILHMDDWLGRLFKYFRDTGLWDNTLILITSDHGEEFMDHGHMGHGRALYEESIRVPLLVHAPGLEPGRVQEVVESIDIPVTVLDYLGIETDAPFQGRSLKPWITPKQEQEQERETEPEMAASDGNETKAYAQETERAAHSEFGKQVAARTSGGKFIHHFGSGYSQWYDLTQDPGEQADLVRQGYEPPAQWVPDLEKFQQTNRDLLDHETTVETEMSREVREQLRALGYID